MSHKQQFAHKEGHAVKHRVCLVIPAYNEATVLPAVVKDLLQIFHKSAYEAHIVVVDDGSTDNTIHHAQEAGAFVIPHILNTGCGGATATGLRYAQQQGFSIAATLDADGQHTASDVLEGIRILDQGEHDLLIGSRLVSSTGMSRTKRIGNRGLSAITYALFGVQVTDSQSGLRIFSERALNELKWKTNGYEFCSEMLWRAKQLGLRIGEYPIEAIYTDYSQGKGQNNWNGFNIVKSLLRRRVMEFFDE